MAAASLLASASASLGAVVYRETSSAGLNSSTATVPAVLDDINFAAATTGTQELSAMTLALGVLPGTTAQAAAVFVDFYDTFNAASTTGSVVSDYIGGFGGTVNLSANTGVTTLYGAFTFGSLTGLSTPILFKDNNLAVVITVTDTTGNFYSTVATPGLSVAAPTTGTSILGVYRDTDGDGDFSATEFNATQGNLYLSITTIAAPVPEPSTWAMMGLGLVAGAVVVRRRMVA